MNRAGPGEASRRSRVQAFVAGADEAGAVLDAAYGAFQRGGQPAFRLAEDDVGERQWSAALGQLARAAPDVGGDRTGMAGQWETNCS